MRNNYLNNQTQIVN